MMPTCGGITPPQEKAIVLAFSPSRSGEILREFFPTARREEVQTDGATMHPGAFKHHANIVHFERVGHYDYAVFPGPVKAAKHIC